MNFPYWAINSVKAVEILTVEQFNRVKDNRSQYNDTVLFTIGYEEISLEEYLNRLIVNNIKVLIDVRNNPISMKYGFSKNQLQLKCNYLGIEYVYIPEVGIHSELRQEPNTQEDYEKLFAVYRDDNLPNTKPPPERILFLLREKKRIALTCFEANECQCHRKQLADAIEKLPDFKYIIKHI